MSAAPTNDTYTHVVPLADGELRLTAAGPRVNVSHRSRDGRRIITASLPAETAEQAFVRGLELVKLAKAARQRAS